MDRAADVDGEQSVAHDQRTDPASLVEATLDRPRAITVGAAPNRGDALGLEAHDRTKHAQRGHTVEVDALEAGDVSRLQLEFARCVVAIGAERRAPHRDVAEDSAAKQSDLRRPHTLL